MKILIFLSLIMNMGTQIAKADTGILLLAHGSMNMTPGKMCNNNNPSEWEKAVLVAKNNIESQLPYKSEVAFGMWSTMCIEAGIMRLKHKLMADDKKLDHIIVLPLFISSDSAVIEMQKYIFKKRMDRIIPIPTVKQTKFTGKISYLKAMDYHPQISTILSRRLSSLIKMANDEGIAEENMEVILVMHGPVGDEDNQKWMQFAQKYIDDIMKKRLPNNKSYIISLRDDADDEVRDQATQNLRYLVSNASRSKRKSLILPLLLSKGGIEKGILKRLDGLDFIWTGEMLLPSLLLEGFLLDRLSLY